MALTRQVTVNQPVSGHIADLVYFVKKLKALGVITFVGEVTDDRLVTLADDFWDTQHGED